MTGWDLFCKDCKEYVHIGQGYGVFSFTCLGETMPVVESFISEHERHNLVILTDTTQETDEFIELSMDSKKITKEYD